MKPGHIAATVSSSNMPVLEKTLWRGPDFVSATCCIRFSWFDWCVIKQGKMTSLSNVASFALLTNCPLPPPHSVFFMPQSASGAPACELSPENASFVCTRRGLSSFSRPLKMFPRVRRPLLFGGKNASEVTTNKNSNNEIYLLKYAICNSSFCLKVTSG